MAAEEEQVVPLPVTPARTQWRALAIAASVAFLLGMSTRWISWPVAPDTLSLAQGRHVPRLWGRAFIHAVDERVSLHTINAKMEKYGATLSEMPGMKVTYVNHCAFYQGTGPAHGAAGQDGTGHPVPRPQAPATDDPVRFCRRDPQGEILLPQGANMVLIGDMQEPSPRLPASLSHVCTGPFNRP